MVKTMTNYHKLPSSSLQTSHSTPNCLFEDDDKDPGDENENDHVNERLYINTQRSIDDESHDIDTQQFNTTPILPLNGHRMAIPPHMPGSGRGRKISNISYLGFRFTHQTSIDSPPTLQKNSRKNLYLNNNQSYSNYFHGIHTSPNSGQQQRIKTLQAANPYLSASMIGLSSNHRKHSD